MSYPADSFSPKDFLFDRLIPSETDTQLQRLNIDSFFRIGFSVLTLVAAVLLWSLGNPFSLSALVTLLLGYAAFYLSSWIYMSRHGYSRLLDDVLKTIDICAVHSAVYLTGGIHSPLFYLYAIPLLVQAFHFDTHTVYLTSFLSLAGYGLLCWRQTYHHWSAEQLPIIAGQLVFLITLVTLAIVVAKLLKKKETASRRGIQELDAAVQFLSRLNAEAFGKGLPEIEKQLVRDLNNALKPLSTYARLWIYNEPWKTLQGIGEHPALRPGSGRNLPSTGCPAFTLKRAFSYREGKDAPCPTEQFNYAAHLCLPITSERETFGVLFLGTYQKAGWSSQDLHFFNTLAHAIALTLQRQSLFDRLQEKISELKFSFEVGTSSLASFSGSTQSMDETTLHILDAVRSILRVDRASLMIWDETDQCLQTQWVRGGDFQIQSPLKLAIGEGMAGWALQTGEAYWAEYAMGDPHYLSSSQPIKSLLCVPVFTMDHKPLGVINAVSIAETRTFAPREINFLKTFGRQAALAIENAHLHHRNRANIEQLKALDRMKSEFLSLVSHDLRGPLTGIRGFSEILREGGHGNLNDEQRHILDLLGNQVTLQERMVDDLLDLARMERGKLSIQIAPTQIQSILLEEVVKSQREAEERNIRLNYEGNDGKDLPLVSVDAGRIRQVVWNLIHNALKFTSEEGTVSVRAFGTDQEVIVEFRDTGIGLSNDMQAHIFDKFFQVSPGGSKGNQGLGLGLAICKEIVAAHHGRIWAQSPGLGQGTVISFAIPTVVSEHPRVYAA